MKAEEHAEEICQLYRSGLAMAVVARKIGYKYKIDPLCSNTIKKILQANNEKIRTNKPKGKGFYNYGKSENSGFIRYKQDEST